MDTVLFSILFSRGGKFREIPFAVDIIFAGGKFRAKSKFAKIAKNYSTRKNWCYAVFDLVCLALNKTNISIISKIYGFSQYVKEYILQTDDYIYAKLITAMYMVAEGPRYTSKHQLQRGDNHTER